MKTSSTVTLALIAIVTGCSASPDKPADPLEDHVAWQSANADMERYFEETDLPDTLDAPIPAIKFILDQKARGYGDIRSKFISLYETNDLELRSAATLRVAQVDMNFACDVTSMAPPSSVDSSSAKAIEEPLVEIASPILKRANEHLEQAAAMGDNAYSEAASELKRGFPPLEDVEAVKAYCESNLNAWYRRPSAPFAARMRSQCELGIAEACYVASLVVDDEEVRKKLAKRACDDGISEACERPLSPEELGTLSAPSTCEEGAEWACWKEAAVVDPEELQTYTDYCFKGSGFDCMKRGLLLERDDALLDACESGAIPQATSLDEARGACDSGDARACFQLGVATYGAGPRELEKAEPAGMLGMLGTGRTAVAPTLDELSAGCDAGEAADCLKAAGRVPRESSDRVLYLKKACKYDSPEGCYRWGRAVRQNENAPPEARREAMTAIRGACKNGYLSACETVAVAYATGEDLPQSKVCGARILFESCSPDSPMRCLSFPKILP